jgi:L-fuconolactonase
MIIEWNHHLFSSDTARYPFHAKAAYRPDVSRLSADPIGDYLARMKQEGIDGAVLVHPEPYGDDHALVREAISRHPDLFRAVSLFYPHDPEAPDKLDALVRAVPQFVATRFHAHRGKEMYLDSFADPGVRALWERAAALGQIIELHIGPNYARQVAQAIREYPSTTVLIDHLAEPGMGNIVEYMSVLELAKFPNVIMKLSGLNHVSTEPSPHLDVQPLVRGLADAFGPDRLVWGSGTPGIIDAHLPHLPKADRAKIKGENLAQLLGWG